MREFGVRIVNNRRAKVDVNNDYITITEVDRQEMDAYFPYGLPCLSTLCRSQRRAGVGGREQCLA